MRPRTVPEWQHREDRRPGHLQVLHGGQRHDPLGEGYKIVGGLGGLPATRTPTARAPHARRAPRKAQYAVKSAKLLAQATGGFTRLNSTTTPSSVGRRLPLTRSDRSSARLPNQSLNRLERLKRGFCGGSALTLHQPQPPSSQEGKLPTLTPQPFALSMAEA